MAATRLGCAATPAARCRGWRTAAARAAGCCERSRRTWCTANGARRCARDGRSRSGCRAPLPARVRRRRRASCSGSPEPARRGPGPSGDMRLPGISKFEGRSRNVEVGRDVRARDVGAVVGVQPAENGGDDAEHRELEDPAQHANIAPERRALGAGGNRFGTVSAARRPSRTSRRVSDTAGCTSTHRRSTAH